MIKCCRLTALVLAVVLSLFSVMTVYAANDRIYGDDDPVYNWEKVDNEWVCTDEFDEPVVGWAPKGEYMYFLNKQGKIRTGWIKSEGKWYYLYDKADKVDASLVGTLAKDTWIDNYYVDKDGVQTKTKK